jgi:hypothetical protein
VPGQDRTDFPVVAQNASDEEQRKIMRGMFGHQSVEDRPGAPPVASQLFPRERFDAMVGSFTQSRTAGR